MSDELDLEDWEPEPIKPVVERLEKHALPFRADPKAEKRKALCIPATSRRFDCPGCGIAKNVDPVYSGEEWHYFGQCSFCGTRWAHAYYLLRRCEDCSKKVPMTSRNPEGKCSCEGEPVRPF